MSNTVSPTTNTHNTYSQEPAVKETLCRSKTPAIPTTSRRVFDPDPYIRCKKQALYDSAISMKAKAIWFYGMSRPDGWKFYVCEIVKHCTDGKDAIRSGMKELIAAGYLEKNVIRDDKGRITSHEYVFFESKKSLPDRENPDMDFPHQDNPPLLIKDYKRLKKENMSVTQPPVGASVIADPPKTKILEPQEIGLIESHTVTDMVGAKTNIRFNDLFLLLMKEKFEFKTLELKEAWEILKGYQGPVSSIAKFMIGTIENLRKKQKSKDIKNAHSQGGTTCMTQEEKQADIQISPSKENYCSLTPEQIAMIRSSHQAKLQKK